MANENMVLEQVSRGEGWTCYKWTAMEEAIGLFFDRDQLMKMFDKVASWYNLSADMKLGGNAVAVLNYEGGEVLIDVDTLTTFIVDKFSDEKVKKFPFASPGGAEGLMGLNQFFAQFGFKYSEARQEFSRFKVKVKPASVGPSKNAIRLARSWMCRWAERYVNDTFNLYTTDIKNGGELWGQNNVVHLAKTLGYKFDRNVKIKRFDHDWVNGKWVTTVSDQTHWEAVICSSHVTKDITEDDFLTACEQFFESVVEVLYKKEKGDN